MSCGIGCRYNKISGVGGEGSPLPGGLLMSAFQCCIDHRHRWLTHHRGCILPYFQGHTQLHCRWEYPKMGGTGKKGRGVAHWKYDLLFLSLPLPPSLSYTHTHHSHIHKHMHTHTHILENIHKHAFLKIPKKSAYEQCNTLPIVTEPVVYKAYLQLRTYIYNYTHLYIHY